MDDLSGLEWSSTSKPTPKAPAIPTGANYFASRATQQTPSPFQSGRNTPLSAQQSRTNLPAGGPAKQPSAADSFSNLVNFAPAKSTANLSLRERQQQLEAEKLKKETEKRKQSETQFGGSHFLDTLGSASASRTTSPATQPPFRQPPTAAATPQNGTLRGDADDDADLFAAFNAETKVDNASYYPPPPEKKSTPDATRGLDLSSPSAWGQNTNHSDGRLGVDDDDPFGLNNVKAAKAAPPSVSAGEDEDFLGDLGRPVEEVRQKQPQTLTRQPEPGKPIESPESESDSDSDRDAPARRGTREVLDDFDRAVAQLVDYGFTPENARLGLTESGAGLNVQAAANWLLDDAHRQANAKAKGRDPSAGSRNRNNSSQRDIPRRTDSQSPAGGGDDFQRSAAAMGNSIFKTANSLWKSGKKQVAQAYADFNQEGDPSQPKWMRAGPQGQAEGFPPAGKSSSAAATRATDEAMMLEGGMRPERQGSHRPHSSRPEPPRTSSPAFSQSNPAARSAASRDSPVPRWQQAAAPIIPDSKARAGRLAMDDSNETSYVSPHRRKKPAPPPSQSLPPQSHKEEPDLMFSSEARTSQRPPATRQAPAEASVRAPQPVRRPAASPAPKSTPPPARNVPSISPAALQQSTKHRLDGTQHFKRGDFGAAHASYSSSLAAVPPSHPLAIIILTNRSLTSLKTGEPKKAVEDADAALNIIGPSNGQGEHVTVTNDTGSEERRDMRDLYGKALSRKAEALEQMERWGDAGTVWQLCVEGGVGGPTAIAGRQRCQAVLAPKPKPKSAPPTTRPAVSAATRRPRPDAPPQKSSEAVERLRKQHEAAAAEDDEKFALSDKVDARISAWRDGKRDNLRALLGSLDTVLWEGSGWKKVGLHELVMANKVKIVYMKAIAKCHPDKIPQDATTEMKLVAATVFATLNESWDKFKADNGL